MNVAIGWHLKLLAAVFLVAWGGVVWIVTDRSYPSRGVSLEAVPPIIERGGLEDIIVRLDVLRPCRIIIHRTMVDAVGTSYDLHDWQTWLARGQRSLSAGFNVPDDAALGPAVYWSQAEYVCGIGDHLWPLRGPRHHTPFLIVAAASRLAPSP